jgi:hypothetical protein
MRPREIGRRIEPDGVEHRPRSHVIERDVETSKDSGMRIVLGGKHKEQHFPSFLHDEHLLLQPFHIRSSHPRPSPTLLGFPPTRSLP